MVNTIRNIVRSKLNESISPQDATKIDIVVSHDQSTYARFEAYSSFANAEVGTIAVNPATTIRAGLEILRLHNTEDGREDRARVLEDIYSLLPELNDEQLAFYICLLLSTKMYLQFDNAGRQKALEVAENIVEQLPLEQRVWLHAFRALQLQSSGELQAAHDLLQEALSHANLPNVIHVNVLIELASLYRVMGKYDESLSMCMQAISKIPDDDGLLATVYNNLGATQLQKGNNSVGKDYFEQALELATSSNNMAAVGTSLLNLGGYYYFIGDNTRALQYFIQAREPLQELGDLAGCAGAMMNIGVIYSQTGEPDKALQYYQQSAHMRARIGQKHLLPEVQINMGLCHLRMGDTCAAHVEAQTVLDLASEMNLVKEAAMAHCVKAMAYSADKEYQLAIGSYNKSLQLSVEVNYIRGQADALWEMAEVYLHMNEPTKALSLLEEALDVVEQLGETKTLSELHGVLARTYADLQQYQRAWHHEQEKHAKWIEFEEQENAANLRKIKKQFEVDEAQRRAESAEQRSVELREAYNKLRLREEQLRVMTDELEATNVELQQSNKSLAKLNQDKDEFLGIATHELKNPLNTIKLITSLLAKEGEDSNNEVVVEYGRDIHRTTSRMLKIVQGLLEVNRIELGKITPAMSVQDIVPLMQGLVQIYQDQATEKNIHIHFESPEVAVLVKTDPDLLIQIADNLISNALKFSEQNTDIHVSVVRKSNVVWISVRDQGPGLTDEDKRHLFEKFVRLSAQPTAGEHSTGLGLNIAQKLAQVVGGTIEVESSLGSGSEFSIVLPALS